MKNLNLNSSLRISLLNKYVCFLLLPLNVKCALQSTSNQPSAVKHMIIQITMTSLNKKLEIESSLLDLLLIFKSSRIRSIKMQNDSFFRSKSINQKTWSSIRRSWSVILKMLTFVVVASSDSFWRTCYISSCATVLHVLENDLLSIVSLSLKSLLKSLLKNSAYNLPLFVLHKWKSFNFSINIIQPFT